MFSRGNVVPHLFYKNTRVLYQIYYIVCLTRINVTYFDKHVYWVIPENVHTTPTEEIGS
jgi:hypothetical protein